MKLLKNINIFCVRPLTSDIKGVTFPHVIHSLIGLCQIRELHIHTVCVILLLNQNLPYFHEESGLTRSENCVSGRRCFCRAHGIIAPVNQSLCFNLTIRLMQMALWRSIFSR